MINKVLAAKTRLNITKNQGVTAKGSNIAASSVFVCSFPRGRQPLAWKLPRHRRFEGRQITSRGESRQFEGRQKHIDFGNALGTVKTYRFQNFWVLGLLRTRSDRARPCCRISGCLACWAKGLIAPGRAAEFPGAWPAGHRV